MDFPRTRGGFQERYGNKPDALAAPPGASGESTAGNRNRRRLVLEGFVANSRAPDLRSAAGAPVAIPDRRAQLVSNNFERNLLTTLDQG